METSAMAAVVDAITPFWANVRAASRRLSNKATVDSPKLDTTQYEKFFQRSEEWLNPNAVANFNEGDWSFLTGAERGKLADCVRDFVAATQAPGSASSITEASRTQARVAFQGVLEVLRPDKFGDPEALVIGKELESRLQGTFPDWVNGLRIDTDYDSTGEPGIWIWAEIDDAAAADDVLLNNYNTVEDQLRTALKQMNVTRWPYVRIRTTSEQSA